MSATPERERFALRATLEDVWRAISVRAKARPKLAVAIVLVGLVSVYSGVFGWILYQRYRAFQTFAWDLGNYNQALYTTLFSHRLFYYTADSSSAGIGSILGTHFSPILFLLLPFYAVVPSASTLLVIQAAGLAAGVIPLYFLSRRAGLSGTWALLVGGAYLASPVLMGIGWYDFHTEAFLPVTVFLAVYCYYYSGRWAFVLSWLLCLSVIETISPLLFLFVVGGIIGLLFDKFRGISRPRLVWEKTIIAAVVVPLWLGVAQLFAVTVNHGEFSTLGTGYSSAFSVLGPNLSLISVLPYALLHPSAALSAIQSDSFNKLCYVLVLFGSLAFLPLLGPKRLLLAAVGWLALVLLSNGGSLIEFGNQYAAYGFSFLAAGTPFGLVRLRAFLSSRASARPVSSTPPVSGRRRRQLRRAIGASAAVSAVVLAVVVSSAMVSPLLADPLWSYPAVAHGWPTVTEHDLLLDQIIALIPPGAGVLTVSPVFPEVSSRLHAYVVPISASFRPNLTFDEALGNYINNSQYVLLDYHLDFFGSSVLVRFGDLSGFGILAEADQIVLLERGWSGSPHLWIPMHQVWCGSQINATPFSHADPGNVTRCGMALSSVANPPINALLWNGPYYYGLVPGEYSVTLWISVAAQVSGLQLRVDCVSYPIEIQLSQFGANSSEHAYGFTFSSGESQVKLNSTYYGNPSSTPRTVSNNDTMTFDWSTLSIWGLAGWVYANDTEVHLYSVTLQQLTP